MVSPGVSVRRGRERRRVVRRPVDIVLTLHFDDGPVQPSRKQVVVGIFLGIGLLTALILLEVFATVFFAMTVAYVFSPVNAWLRRNNVPKWWAGVVTTLLAFFSAVLVFAPIVVIVYLRRNQLIDLISRFPEDITVGLYGYSTSITLAELQAFAQEYVRTTALNLAGALPTLLIKFGLFVLVLFALFIAKSRVKHAVLAIAPEEYHDVVAALVVRAEETLFAIYVLQALTGFGTFLIAVPMFWLLGYDAPFGLALISGILQFVPIIGPSVLIAILGGFELAVGNTVGAIQIVIVGGLAIGVVPDLVIRPRFARRTADMPGSLYFIGFTGGVFSLGAIGIIAGPLVVAMFSESIRLLSYEMDGSTDSPLADELGFDPEWDSESAQLAMHRQPDDFEVGSGASSGARPEWASTDEPPDTGLDGGGTDEPPDTGLDGGGTDEPPGGDGVGPDGGGTDEPPGGDGAGPDGGGDGAEGTDGTESGDDA